MKLLVLGGTSASGKEFMVAFRRYFPSAPVCDVSRLELFSEFSNYSLCSSLHEVILGRVADFQPSHIINFLGSFSNDFDTDLIANVVVPRALLEAASSSAAQASIVLIGSAAEYGIPLDPISPVDESHPCRPLTVYGLTKHMQSLLACQYATRKTPINVKLARTFNIISKELSDKLFVGKIYRQIEEIRAGKRCEITCGWLDDVRDYLPISQAVDDYIRILLYGSPGETYNVCSGNPITMRRLLTEILTQEGLLHIPIISSQSSHRSNVAKIYGSRAKLDRLPKLIQPA